MHLSTFNLDAADDLLESHSVGKSLGFISHGEIVLMLICLNIGGGNRGCIGWRFG